ncbi:MAG: hypothetical protein P4M11_08710, partial [Candidatus Pacebacteria bacterium]|nr:hypothetical protein [Candidatus Paceibacterota bacterium]
PLSTRPSSSSQRRSEQELQSEVNDYYMLAVGFVAGCSGSFVNLCLAIWSVGISLDPSSTLALSARYL